MAQKEFAIETVRSFVADCKKVGVQFDKVLLFGSYAKEEAHEWSDIDLLLVSNKFNHNIFDNIKLYSKVNIRYPLIETHPYPTEYFLQSDPFLEEIKKYAIEIN
jgi:predicted nucleotidyltransferase